MLFSACASLVSDGPASASFEGRRYAGSPSQGFDIGPEDLTPVGIATDVNVPAANATMFELRGVPPSEVLVMQADSNFETDYLMLYAVKGTRPLQLIPSLCGYVAASGPPPIDCSN